MLPEVRLVAPAIAVTALLAPGCLVSVVVKEVGEAASASSSTSSSSASTGDLSTGSGSGTPTSGTADEPTPTSGGGDLPRFDLGPEDSGPICSLQPQPCDLESEDLGHALGLGCPGGVQGELTAFGPSESRAVLADVLGPTDTYAPLEGARRVVLSTGVAEHVRLNLAEIEVKAGCPKTMTCPSTDHKDGELAALPPPLDPTPQSCPEGQAPPGPGDCSGTLLPQWQIGGDPLVAYDYTELRFAAEVPAGAAALRFHVAFLTAEYPPRSIGGHNDLFVGWVASEGYTGNVALDPEGNALAAETLPYTIKLDPMPMDCEPNCPDAPLRGFAFEGHAGTAWYPAEVPVAVGETIEVVFALFDVGDGEVDSAVLLDGVRWVCDPPPTEG